MAHNRFISRSNLLIWIICALLALAGVGLAIHGFLNLDKANVIVEWSTASELNTVGFYLLRSVNPEGEFEQVNPEIIPSVSDSLTGNSYSYEDKGVQAGIVYFYILEEIEETGGSNRHGPIVVEATSPAKTELWIAGLLIVGAVFYAIILLKDQKLQHPKNTNDSEQALNPEHSQD